MITNKFIFATNMAGKTDGNVIERPPVLTPETKTKPKVDQPKKYKVLLHNDETTPHSFVVKMLQKHFKLAGDRAYAIMMAAEKQDLCVVNVYPKDVAETKVDAVNSESSSTKHPASGSTAKAPRVMQLKFSCEPE